MDNYFTSFRLFVSLPTLELTTLEQGVCSTKIGYAKTLSLRKNSCEKRKVTTLITVAHINQKFCVVCVAGKKGKRALCIASSKSCHNRNFFDVGVKLKESIFKSNNQINFTVTTRTWVLSKEWIRTWQNTGLVSEWKNGGVPVFLNSRCCSLGCAGIVSY